MSEVLYDGRFLRGVRRTRCAFRDITVVTLGGGEYLISDMYPYEAHYRNSIHVTKFHGGTGLTPNGIARPDSGNPDLRLSNIVYRYSYSFFPN